MTQLHEYEAWLDTVDSRFRFGDGSIVYSFDNNYIFPLSMLQDCTSLYEQAEILRGLVFGNTEALPLEYMCRRLVQITNQKSNINIDAEDVIKELNARWGGFYQKAQ